MPQNIVIFRSCLLQLSLNFCCKIFLLLFNTFTELVARESLDCIAAENIRNLLVRILDELLLYEADFLVELVDTALNHLVDHLFRLSFFKCLLAKDFLFMLDGRSIDAGAVDCLWI